MKHNLNAMKRDGLMPDEMRENKRQDFRRLMHARLFERGNWETRVIMIVEDSMSL
jgi:hypothetical protein